MPNSVRLVLIKPSHYDNDGYVILWLRSAMPSNTLAVLYGLALDCKERKTLGPDVDLDITAIDDEVRGIVKRVFAQPKIWLIGSENELAA